jgi:hypothetical protein
MTSSFYLAIFVAPMALVVIILPLVLVFVLLICRDPLSYLPDLREVPSHHCRRDDDQSHNRRDTRTHNSAPSLLSVLLCKPFIPVITISTHSSCLLGNLKDRRTSNQHCCLSSVIPSPHHPEPPPDAPPPRISSRIVDPLPDLRLEEQQYWELAIEVCCGELAAEVRAAERAGVWLLASPCRRVCQGL